MAQWTADESQEAYKHAGITADNTEGRVALKVTRSDKGEINAIKGKVACGACGHEVDFEAHTFGFGSQGVGCPRCPAGMSIGFDPDGDTVYMWSSLTEAPSGATQPKKMRISVTAVE